MGPGAPSAGVDCAHADPLTRAIAGARTLRPPLRSAVGRITVLHDAEAAAHAAAARMAKAVDAARSQRGVAHIALAGGTSPRRAYELFAARIDDWRGIHLWFGDERAVAGDDPLANHAMAASVLPPDRLHRIAGERGAERAAAAYADELAEIVAARDGNLPVLDLAVLGLGEDGHTASLFPGNPALAAGGICVAVADAPNPPPDRITLTLPMLRAARARLLVASGASKAQPVAALVACRAVAVPASLLGPAATELLIDEAAASGVADELRPSGAPREAPIVPLSCSIIGSFRRHYALALAAAEEFQQRGIGVLSPPRSQIVRPDVNFVRFLVDDPEASDEEIQLIALHRILSSDFVFVIVIDGYVGPSTAYEIGRAVERCVPVFFSDRPTDLPLPVPDAAVVAPAELANDPGGRLASVARMSEDARVQELHEDLLAGRFQRDAHLRSTPGR